jgi:hypothetical protein
MVLTFPYAILQRWAVDGWDGGLEEWLLVFFLDVFTGNQLECLGLGSQDI